jgi:hypothetical protein
VRILLISSGFNAFYEYGIYKGWGDEDGIGVYDYLRLTDAGETPKN